MWSGKSVSNRQHPAWKAGALPIELLPRGAGDGIRTHDINLGKVALYQLSYARTLIKSTFIK